MEKSERVLVRAAIASDYSAIRQLLNALENTVLPEGDLESAFKANLLNQNNLYLIAEGESNIIGFISCHLQLLLHHAAWIGEIQELVVDKEWRGRGIGEQLMQAIMDAARKRGIRQLEVTAHLNRTDAHLFYEREGFAYTHKKFVAVL